MTFVKPVFTIAVAAALAVAGLQAADAAEKNQKDIVETAVSAGSFNTLAAALKAADLVQPLQGDGPFTVFAPTDEAFAKLPKGTVENLLKPENKEKLAAILTYHVVAGKVPASAVVDLEYAPTLNGQRADIQVDGNAVKVDNATVVKTDILCKNGIIHVIDAVILPKADSIPAVAQQAGTFNTLIAALKAAGLAEAISGKGPFTVFAPTDEAFGRLPEGTLDSLLKPENKDKLTAILKYHVVPGRVYSDQALKAGSAKTLQGDAVQVKLSGDKAKVNESNLIKTDIEAANGVIHVIDAVLLPPEKKQANAIEGRQMIEHAVARGVKLYNSGHHARCAKLYGDTARQMVELGETMPPLAMANLKHAIEKAEECHCPKMRAWTLRHGLERAYFAMDRHE